MIDALDEADRRQLPNQFPNFPDTENLPRYMQVYKV